MNSTQIQNRLRIHYNHDYILENTYVFYWESDYFGFTKAGYCNEIEVKISVSDFRADFKKNFKHRCLSNPKQEKIAHEYPEMTTMVKDGIISDPGKRERHNYKKVGIGYCQLTYGRNIIPNRFYYAVPELLVEKVIKLVPEYAGLLSVTNRGVIEIKNAPLLHKEKMFEKLTKVLLNKYWYLSERQRIEIKNRQTRLYL